MGEFRSHRKNLCGKSSRNSPTSTDILGVVYHVYCVCVYIIKLKLLVIMI